MIVLYRTYIDLTHPDLEKRKYESIFLNIWIQISDPVIVQQIRTNRTDGRDEVLWKVATHVVKLLGFYEFRKSTKTKSQTKTQKA